MKEKKKSGFIVNFIVRSISGMGIVFLANQVLAAAGVAIAVGLNVITFLTSGILGIPGVFLLYGILAYQFL